MIWTIFNSDDMPRRMLGVDYRINTHATHVGIDYLISRAKQQLAMRIAQKIMEADDIFLIKEIKGEEVIDISGSVVVLTAVEWRSAMQDQFKRGMECGAGMMPRNVSYVHNQPERTEP